MHPEDTVGAYRLMEHLGDGGMAEVWKVEHSILNQPPAALKLLLPNVMRQPQLRERFHEEARLQKRLQHPHILGVQEVIATERHLGMITEIADTDLQKHIQEVSGPIPWHLAKELFLPLLSAVEFAHEHGVIHRDLKPSNVLLFREGNRLIPKLTDFGIAKSGDKSKTQTGSVMGTLAYMAPEQHRDVKNIDLRADIYALGMTLYEMLTGRVAFVADSDYDLIHSKLTESPPSPTEFYPHIPEAIVDAVLDSLAQEPDQRPANCADLRERLLAVHGDHGKDLGAVETTEAEIAPPLVDHRKAIEEEMVEDTNLDIASNSTQYPKPQLSLPESSTVPPKKGSEEQASNYFELAYNYGEMGDHDRAIEYYEKCLAIEYEVFGGEDLVVASTYFQLGLSYKQALRCVRAMEALKQCLAIRLRLFGEVHTEVAATFDALADVYWKLGLHIEALRAEIRSSTIKAQLLG